MKKYFTFKPVFIGYGLKTGQGFYPGPNFLYEYQLFILLITLLVFLHYYLFFAGLLNQVNF